MDVIGTFWWARTRELYYNGVFPKCFHWIQRIQWQKKFHRSNRIRTPATFCVWDQHATTVPAQHMWETGTLNWTQFMLQWLSVSLNSLNSVKVTLHLGKTPLCDISWMPFLHRCIRQIEYNGEMHWSLWHSFFKMWVLAKYFAEDSLNSAYKIEMSEWICYSMEP